MAAPERQLAADLVAWAHAIAPRVGYTRAPAKDQFGQRLTYNGLQVDISAAPVASIKAAKLNSVYADLAYLVEVGTDGRLPVEWYRSFMGSLEWVAELDAGVRLRRFHIRAPLTRAERKGHRFVTVARTAVDTAQAMLDRALRGEARATRPLPVDVVAAFSVAMSLTEAGVQAMPAPAAGRPGVLGVASDASLQGGTVTCGVLHGAGEAVYIRRPARPGESSTSAELSALADTAEDIFLEAGSTIAVWVTDNKGAADVVNSRNLRLDSGTFVDLDRIFSAAERAGVELFALWVPRTANTLADALTNCRSHEEAAGWAARHGRALRPAPPARG